MADLETQHGRNIQTLALTTEGAAMALDRFYLATHQNHIFKAGIRYFKYLTEDVMDSCDRSSANGFNPAINIKLGKAVTAARDGGVPDGLIKSAIDYARQGYDGISGFDDLMKIYCDRDEAENRLHVLFEDEIVEAAMTGREAVCETGHVRAEKLWQKIHEYQWQGCDIALCFEPLEQRSAAAAEIDISLFVTADGQVMEDLLKSHLTQQMKQGVYIFHPIRLAAAVLKMGIDYNSNAGDQLMMALAGILSASAVLSALALGKQPRVKAPQKIADETESWKNNFLGLPSGTLKKPPRLSVKNIPYPEIRRCLDQLQKTCQAALAQDIPLTLPIIDISEEVSQPAYRPLLQPVVYLPEGDTGCFKKCLDPLLSERILDWGYTEQELAAVTSYCIGHGSLVGAPEINPETLRKKGLYQAQIDAIEDSIRNVSDIRYAFNKWVLGEAFCQKVLGFSAEQLDDPLFDVLAGIGYTEEEIEAAGLYCCGAGKLEGAPFLTTAQMQVLDQIALTPAEEIKLQAGLQSMITGNVIAGIAAPHDISIEEMKDLSVQAWGSGLSYVRILREKSGWDAPFFMADFEDGDEMKISPVQTLARDVA